MTGEETRRPEPSVGVVTVSYGSSGELATFLATLRASRGIDPRVVIVDNLTTRLEYVPDLRDLDATVGRCRADGGVLFTLHAPRVEDVIAVAERGEAMSPKTTYVQPKPRTGIFLS